MGTRMCGNVGAVDKEKTSLDVLNVPETAFPICITWTRFPGLRWSGPFLPRKWVLGDHFSTENFGPGDQNFQDQNSGDNTGSQSLVTAVLTGVTTPGCWVWEQDYTCKSNQPRASEGTNQRSRTLSPIKQIILIPFGSTSTRSTSRKWPPYPSFIGKGMMHAAEQTQGHMYTYSSNWTFGWHFRFSFLAFWVVFIRAFLRDFRLRTFAMPHSDTTCNLTVL